MTNIHTPERGLEEFFEEYQVRRMQSKQLTDRMMGRKKYLHLVNHYLPTGKIKNTKHSRAHAISRKGKLVFAR